MRKILLLFILMLTVHVHAVHVVFRMDDPTISADSVTMRVLHMFQDKQVPLSIAMIPCDSDELPFEVTDSVYFSMLQSSNIEIALHGFNHANINNGGEFGTIDSLETDRRIRMGKTILESKLGKEIVTFIPPFNSINEYVPAILKNNGMYILSSDMYDYSYDSNIQYYPETLDKSLAKKGFVSAAVDAIENAYKDEICVLMFHHYDLECEKSWIRLNNILDSCVANPNVELHTFRSLYERGIYSNYQRYRANQLKSGAQKYFLHEGVLHTTWLCWMVHVLNALLYALVPLVALLIGWCVVRRKKVRLSKSVVAVSVLLSLAFFMLAMLQMSGPLTLLAMDVVGSVIGLVIYFVIVSVKSR